jgi:RHS repeat-associated protein
LSTKLNNSSHTTLNSHAYLNNVANQRTRQTRTDGSYVNYGYDTNEFGQLISAVGSGGQSPENLGYLYDPAANLNKRTNNGVVTTFVVNNLNQLTNVDIVTYSYDWNGNLTSTSDYRSYSYDDENQLTRAEQYQQWRTDFVYDGRGRLRVRAEYVWLGSGWYPNGETRYLYDGRLVIQERNGSNTPTVSYTRGVDLSGSFQGGGGIGGLLARSHGYSSGSWSYHNFYHADGNGNITYMVNASQTRVAEYRYDPYGRSLYTYDSLPSGGNRYRFSSKELVISGNLYYYGYRFYDPNLQRWLNRDPMAEQSGLNLYGFVANNPINYVDTLGLAYGNPVPPCYPYPDCLRPPPRPLNMWDEFFSDSSGYMACYLKCIGLDLVLEATDKAGGGKVAGRFYYSQKYPRWFKAGGRYSKVLVPRFAGALAGYVIAPLSICQAIRCANKCWKETSGADPDPPPTYFPPYLPEWPGKGHNAPPVTIF